MTRSRIGGLAAVTLLILAAPGRANAQATIESGERVRITVTDSAAARLGARRWDSRLLTVFADSIALDTTLASGPLVIPQGEILKVERYAGRKAKTGKGAAIGTGIGAALGGLGLAIGAASSSCSGFDLYCSEGAGAWGALGFAGGALVGAGVGAIVGSFVQGDSWKKVEMPVTAVPTVSQGVPGIAVRVEF
jgi:hypothetical protein